MFGKRKTSEQIEKEYLEEIDEELREGEFCANFCAFNLTVSGMDHILRKGYVLVSASTEYSDYWFKKKT